MFAMSVRSTILAGAATALLGVYHARNQASVSLCQARWVEDWDGRGEINSHGKRGQRRTFILVRHGQYVSNSKVDEERILTDLGKKQASETATRLSTLLASKQLPPLRRIVYSTMTRATETHDIILSGLLDNANDSVKPGIVLPEKSEACDLIREGAVCRPVPDTWMHPTDEEYIEDGLRVEKAFKKYFHRGEQGEKNDDESVLMVCHGNVIRYLVMRALQLPPEAWLRTSVANASVTVISIGPTGLVSLRCMGETGHFPPDLITYN